MPQPDPALSMLGLSRRANRLSVGSEAVTDAIRRGKARLVVLAADISEKSEKELRYHAGKASIPVIRISRTLTDLSHAIGIRAGIVSVDDQGLADAVQSRLTN